jgi:hypothetical protein
MDLFIHDRTKCRHIHKPYLFHLQLNVQWHQIMTSEVADTAFWRPLCESYLGVKGMCEIARKNLHFYQELWGDNTTRCDSSIKKKRSVARSFSHDGGMDSYRLSFPARLSQHKHVSSATRQNATEKPRILDLNAHRDSDERSHPAFNFNSSSKNLPDDSHILLGLKK